MLFPQNARWQFGKTSSCHDSLRRQSDFNANRSDREISAQCVAGTDGASDRAEIGTAPIDRTDKVRERLECSQDVRGGNDVKRTHRCPPLQSTLGNVNPA